MAVLRVLVITVLLIQLTKSAPQRYTQPSFKWAFAQSYSWTYTPNTAQLPYQQQTAAVQLPQPHPRSDPSISSFQNNPYYQTPNTNTNQINSGSPILRQSSHNERLSASEPVNSYHTEPQIIYGSPTSDQHNNRPISPVANPQNLNHASNGYSQTVAEPSEANIQAIVQRVIAEVTKNTSIRQSTNNQELDKIIRRILNEQHQSFNVQKVPLSAPTKIQQYEQSYPSNDVLNSYSNRVATEPQQEDNYLQSGPQLSTAPVVAIAAANSMMPVGIRHMVNVMTYTRV